MTAPAHIADFIGWIERSALPRWGSDGFDREAGRFRERLDAQARSIDVPHRAMVQARQIYVFATAARRGRFADGARLAEQAMASLVRDFCEESAEQASFAFSIGRDGRIVSRVRDAYAHAFILFSIAALYRLKGSSNLLRLADKIIYFIEREMTDQDHGGLFDALPQTDAAKRQNPHMHLLEAYLFLEEAAPGRGYLDRASGIVALFHRCFFQRGRACLLEHFATDWSAHSDPTRATIWEPGHHFEWVWLLDRHAALTATPRDPAADILHARAVGQGLSATGLIFDELDADHGRPLRHASRLWPHTEALKAAASRVASGDDAAPAFADAMAALLLTHFLDAPFGGGWTDHIAMDGQPLVDYVPASSLYHLFLAADEASRIFGPAVPEAARVPL